MELNELKKALEKSVIPAEKYRKELFMANTHLQNSIWSICSNTKLPPIGSSVPDLTHVLNNLSLSQSAPPNTNGLKESLPNLADSLYRSRINDAGVPEINFKLGDCTARDDIKDQFGNSILCFGEGNDTKVLIDDNEKLRVRYVLLTKFYT